VIVAVFGDYILACRKSSGKSQREVASSLGISHVYLGMVERGERRTLPQKHWDALINAVPETTLEGLQDAADRGSVVIFDMGSIPEAYHPIVRSFYRRVRAQDISPEGVEALMAVLGVSVA
jgi:transcriptional regulator with XRE-family HTH domain